MINVIISGCSFTYNSEMTWAGKLEELWNVHNVASCAAGQDYISRQAINKAEELKNEKNKIMICQWSGVHRRAFLSDHDFGFEQGSPYMDKSKYGYWVKNGGNGVDSAVSDNDSAEKHLFEPYRRMYNEKQGAIESLEHIAKTQWYCKLNRIPMLNFWWKDELSNIDVDTSLVDWSMFWFHKKTGGMAEWCIDEMWDPGFADGNHPTKEHHDKFADDVVIPWMVKQLNI